ncbi:hypothetical protein QJS10_CPB12g00782 [Acorus calamus]|uniref:Endonuclease/exonuclease/phosphatase domain-containing protein n=1 Tax=Acorus calamus TaxID=4465 RepID=A0AAV9DQX3_ACOCL|nr:hypothetical protein QJS10_CPB12g00782 [Acorus calamus]
MTLNALGAGRLDQMVFKAAEGASGGILIGWNSSDWALQDQVIGTYSISGLFQDTRTGWRWMLSGVYGPQGELEREMLWSELSTIKEAWDVPWCVARDFNVTRFAEDRNRAGGSSAAMDKFSALLDAEGFLDLTITNHAYTWSNLRKNPALAKFDRILLSEDWEEAFPCCVVQGLLQISSKKKVTFRYESWWAECPDVEDVIRANWSKPTTELGGAKRLAHKLCRLKNALAWSGLARRKKVEEKARLMEEIAGLD